MKKIKRRTLKTVKSTLWTLLLCAPAVGYSANCTSDADCAENEECQFVTNRVEVCEVDDEGNERCGPVDEETMGFCMERSIECQQDSDCPSHLVCVGGSGSSSAGGGVSGGSSSGMAPPPEPGEAEEVPPPPADGEGDRLIEEEPEEEAGICMFLPSECETDDDCGDHFHCETETYTSCVEPAVPEYDCEGEDCPPVVDYPCDEEEFTESYCAPDEIECDSDDACPSDWSCVETVSFMCDDVGVPYDSDGAMESSDSSGEEGGISLEEEEEVSSCEETVLSQCMPLGVNGPIGSEPQPLPGEVEPNDTTTGNESGSTSGNGEDLQDGNDTPDGEEGDRSADDDDETGSEAAESADVEEGGCSASPNSPAPWALLGLLSFLGLRRREVQGQA